MIIKETLLSYLPNGDLADSLDPFPTLRYALEWVHAYQEEEKTKNVPSASELYLANALMGAQRSVLEHYSKLSKADLTILLRTAMEETIEYEAVAENATVPNQAFATIRDIMKMEHGSVEQESELKQKAARLPPAFNTSQTIVEFLEEPAMLHPGSLEEQARFILQKWQPWIGEWASRLLRGMDYYSEEHQAHFGGPGAPQTLEYRGHWTEAGERYSPDQHWMPDVVMIAKNTLVWLDQLSKQYQREIIRLDQIPEEELDKIADYGFNALWLIGLWERSPASKTIKHWCGNPEAESSAYSVRKYHIADLLGGEEAMETLRYRCTTRGIRLASDMVPNHTSLDSDWVMNHPARFISRSDCPYPGYSFSGESLSPDPNIGIYLEDHYFDRSDAAVVFKRVDHNSGEVRYIYHGNDGTSMPWNDTAQLNYLNTDTRETVIQTILNVARQFPIIRFDAAMTLTKKHFQRLWFPEPGSGSDVASRADFGMSKAEFDAIMGEEFWREVVDRVAAEVPDTLLLAEAFWLMEGYFVRTLGMHRVYNSAFMNMLKLEENENYRLSIKRTLEFDPEILKRFVNFMNNPDEEPAIIQFGDGDKYFGVATLLVTMPGLPMWGHGQTEGLHEKYGMEYIRSYWDEQPDQQLVDRHKREIFPLIKKRYLFAESAHFRFYDFYTANGDVNENVFAFSNAAGTEHSLVFVNNAYDSTRGTIHTSLPFKNRDTDETQVESIADALETRDHPDDYLAFREQRTGLEHLIRIRDLKEYGFTTDLSGYQAKVLLDFALWISTDQTHELFNHLQGRGVKSISEEILILPFHQLYINLELLLDAIWEGKKDQIKKHFQSFTEEVQLHEGFSLNHKTQQNILSALIKSAKDISTYRDRNNYLWFDESVARDAFLMYLAKALGEQSWHSLYDNAYLDRFITRYCSLSDHTWGSLLTIFLSNLTDCNTIIVENKNDAVFRQVLGYNKWAGERYVRKESMDRFLSLCALLGFDKVHDCYEQLVDSDYKFDLFIASIEEGKAPDIS